jgi:hypothetical protein
VLTRLKTGAGPEPSVTLVAGLTQNSIVKGLVEGGFRAGLKGTVVFTGVAGDPPL